MSLYFKAHRDRYYDLLQRVRTDGVWEEWLSFFLEGTETTAHQAARAAVQILHLFEADRKKIDSLGLTPHRPCAFTGTCRGTLTKIGPMAKALKLSVPTVTAALENLTKLKVAKEVTGKRRDRLFAYPRYLHILAKGPNLSRIGNVAPAFFTDLRSRASHPQIFRSNTNWDILLCACCSRPERVICARLFFFDTRDTMSHI